MKVPKRASIEELTVLASWARRNKGTLLLPVALTPAAAPLTDPQLSPCLCYAAQLHVTVGGSNAFLSLAALHGTRVVTAIICSKHPPVHALCGCSELRKLDLSESTLPALPPALSHLTALEYLDLSFNGNLGDEGGGLEPLATLTRLRKLNLSACDLHAVPPALPGLTALECLDLSYNWQLCPGAGSLEHLATLTRLRKLSLAACGLTAVPPALSCLTTLEELDCGYTEELGEDGGSGLALLAALMQLRKLSLAACCLTTVPAVLSGLTALEELDLGVNQLGEEGSSMAQLATLTRLRSLSLQGCSLTTVPLALSRLTALEKLNLSHNEELGQEGSGLEQLAVLTRLRWLDLSYCGPTTVPSALSRLTALEDLNLWGNAGLQAEGCGLQYLCPLLVSAPLQSVRVPQQLAALLPGFMALAPTVTFSAH